MATFVSTTVFEDGIPVVEAVQKLMAIGVDKIELGSTHRPETGVLEKLRATGATLLTHNFFPPTDDRLVLNIASGNHDNRRKSVEFIKRAIDFADALGAPIYTIHPGFLADPVGEGRNEKAYDFNFGKKRALSAAHYAEHMENYFRSLEEIDRYLEGRNVKIAVETQGSITTSEFVMFDRPGDYDDFLKRGYSDKIGINLNLGHMHLAAKVHNFSEKEVIAQLKPRILCVEVSHNEGHYDDHKALVAGSWYFDLLSDRFFADIPLIFEARNVQLADVKNSCKLLDQIH